MFGLPLCRLAQIRGRIVIVDAVLRRCHASHRHVEHAYCSSIALAEAVTVEQMFVTAQNTEMRTGNGMRDQRRHDEVLLSTM